MCCAGKPPTIRRGRAPRTTSSVRNLCLQRLRLVDPLSHHRNAGRDFAQFLLFVQSPQSLRERVGSSGLEFFHRIDARCFEQFCILPGDAFDAKQVRVVRPLQQQGFGNPCLAGHLFPAARRAAFLEQMIGGSDSGCVQALGVFRTNTINVNDRISQLSNSLLTALPPTTFDKVTMVSRGCQPSLHSADWRGAPAGTLKSWPKCLRIEKGDPWR